MWELLIGDEKMSEKARNRIRKAMWDAEEKFKLKNGTHNESYYEGMIDAFRWVLMEV